MNDLNQLYQKLLEIDYKNLYEIEADFFLKLSSAFPENRLPWLTAFLTISNWAGTSMRSGVWTFYEAGNIQDIKTTVQYLRTSKNNELADILEKGIHDYQNTKYSSDYNYPEEWLEEAEEIDDWISKNKDWLLKWEYNILITNRESVLLY